jgi:hypothetical protein
MDLYAIGIEEIFAWLRGPLKYEIAAHERQHLVYG